MFFTSALKPKRTPCLLRIDRLTSKNIMHHAFCIPVFTSRSCTPPAPSRGSVWVVVSPITSAPPKALRLTRRNLVLSSIYVWETLQHPHLARTLIDWHCRPNAAPPRCERRKNSQALKLNGPLAMLFVKIKMEGAGSEGTCCVPGLSSARCTACTCPISIVPLLYFLRWKTASFRGSRRPSPK